jgi:hypothetical protein
LKCSSTVDPAVSGNLTVSASKATVTNYIKVGGTIDVKDVSKNSWHEKVNGNTITVTDENGATIVIDGNPASITVGTKLNGTITITIHSGATCNNIITNSPVTINVDSDAIVKNITANADISIVNYNPRSSINVVASGKVASSGSGKDAIKVTKSTDLAQAKEAAEAAMSAYLAAGGSKGDPLYSALVETLESNVVANIVTATAELNQATESLEAAQGATLAQAKEAAEAAMSAYLTAGGKANDGVYSALVEALESNVVANIVAATAELNQATEALEAAE